ncbi:MAG: hypothetical protein U9Q78_00625, partial [Chloroflexota bacterium]|nr:hypothetical protein [Chloroflexota bacterium]
MKRPRTCIDWRRSWRRRSGDRGTIDQLYLAARLALPEIIAGGKHPPLIFDDPFVRFDAERMERAMELCQEVAQE